MDFGGLDQVFGSIEDFGGDFSDFADFGGDFGDLGGFFDRDEGTIEAFTTAQGLSLSDLDDLGNDFAHDLIGDLDFFALQDLDSAFVDDLLGSAASAGDLDLTASQWGGVIGALDIENILGLNDELTSAAFGALDGDDFSLLPPDEAEALFQASILGFDSDLGESFGDSLSSFGDDVHNLLGATDHEFFAEIKEHMDEIFSSLDFDTLDLYQSALSGDDLGAIIANLGDQLSDTETDQLLGGIGLLTNDDFGDWSGDVGLDVIDVLGGVNEILELDQLEGIIGSFESGDVSALGEDIGSIIENLDFESHGGLLSDFSFGALDTVGAASLGDLDLSDLVGLTNSTGGDDIFNLEGDSLFALADTLLAGGDLDMVDANALGGVFAGLDFDAISDVLDDVADAALVLDTLGANLFDSGGLDFDVIATGTSKTYEVVADLADIAETVLSNVDEGTLIAFAGLFGSS